MSSDNQLVKFTNKWFIMLLITVGIASVYWHPAIIVKNIGEIQFSNSLSDFNTNINVFIKNIRCNIIYDFLFIIAYSSLFYLAYRVFQSSMRIPTSKILVMLCVFPGVFDIIENILLLSLLNNPDSNWLFNTFWIIVRAKWTLIIPFVLINFTIFIYYILRFINSFVK